MRDISARTGIPQPVLQKILTALVGRKLVRSIRGPDGGYFLGRPAEKTTFLDVVTAVEGSLKLTECAGKSNGSPKRKCGVRRNCPNVESMRKVHRLVEELLAAISVAHLAEDAVPEVLTITSVTRRRRR